MAGVKIHAKDTAKDLEEKALEQFAYSLSDTVNRLCDSGEAAGILDVTYDGVLVLIDEADRASPELDFGSFLKTLSERLNKNGCNRVLFGLGGLPSLRDVLYSSHPSSLRNFDQLFLQRLSTDEVIEVVDLSLKRAHEQNQHEYSITDDAIDMLVDLADGIPHFIQEFGHSGFEADTDYNIDDDDVMTGALEEHGAIDQIGSRYYQDTFEKELSAQQRQLLKFVAEDDKVWVSKASVIAKIEGEHGWVDPTFEELVKLGSLLLGEDEGQEAYRFKSLAFQWWVDSQSI